MSFFYNATPGAVVSISGGLSLTKSTASVSSVIANTAATTVSTTIGTVPAGKSWRILSIQVAMDYDANNAGARVEVTLDSVTYVVVYGTEQLAGVTGSQNVVVSWNYANCPVVAATKLVAFVATYPAGVLNKSCVVTYIEE